MSRAQILSNKGHQIAMQKLLVSFARELGNYKIMLRSHPSIPLSHSTPADSEHQQRMILQGENEKDALAQLQECLKAEM